MLNQNLLRNHIIKHYVNRLNLIFRFKKKNLIKRKRLFLFNFNVLYNKFLYNYFIFYSRVKKTPLLTLYGRFDIWCLHICRFLHQFFLKKKKVLQRNKVFNKKRRGHWKFEFNRKNYKNCLDLNYYLYNRYIINTAWSSPNFIARTNKIKFFNIGLLLSALQQFTYKNINIIMHNIFWKRIKLYIFSKKVLEIFHLFYYYHLKNIVFSLESAISALSSCSALGFSSFILFYLRKRRIKNHYPGIYFVKALTKILFKKRMSLNVSHIEGIQIQFNGRVKRSKRTRHIVFIFGLNGSQTLIRNVDYYSGDVTTRDGSIGLQVWIFFRKRILEEYYIRLHLKNKGLLHQ